MSNQLSLVVIKKAFDNWYDKYYKEIDKFPDQNKTKLEEWKIFKQYILDEMKVESKK